MIRIVGKLLVIFLLVYAGVSIWYGRIEEKLQHKTVPARKVVPPQAEEKTEILRKQDDYTIIVKRNIFKAVVEKLPLAAVENQPTELAPTQLKLSLMGTIFGKERDARAIISDDIKRQQDIYQIGDSVQGAMIKAIERGKVVLVVNGKNEVLSLKDREGGGPSYQPSPADFYQEPPEPQEQSQEQLQEQLQEQPQGEAGGSTQATPPAVQSRRQQMRVRPRPVRRPPRPGT